MRCLPSALGMTGTFHYGANHACCIISSRIPAQSQALEHALVALAHFRPSHIFVFSSTCFVAIGRFPGCLQGSSIQMRLLGRAKVPARELDPNKVTRRISCKHLVCLPSALGMSSTFHCERITTVAYFRSCPARSQAFERALIALAQFRPLPNLCFVAIGRFLRCLRRSSSQM